MRISNLSKKYENFHLNWEREDSFQPQIYGIIGANGCGKTTFMKILAGLIPPDNGFIDYGELTPRDMTMVFRKPYLLQKSVIHNLIYPLNIRGIKPDKEQVNRYLKMAGLENLQKQYALSLSSGEQQKLSLIRALIFSPKVIFIDEAFSNMDIESVSVFENHILERQQQSPMTWFIISHQLSNIKHLCDHVFFMHQGRMEVEGATGDVLFNHQNPNLQKYLQYQTI